MLISTLVNIMCILAASDGYGCRSAETPKMKKMRHCKWINFVVILSIWIKPRYSILVNLLPKAGRTLDRVNLLIWLPPGAYHPEGRHGRWHSLVHLRTKILTWFKWLSVTKQDFARFCARFVFPLRNLAQNLARNLARKSCDRTGLRPILTHPKSHEKKGKPRPQQWSTINSLSVHMIGPGECTVI